ncbi:MAG: energy-coupling factor transport system permease protein, partial [Cellvibrionaceae bacterium]
FLSARLVATVHAHPDQRDALPISFGRLALFILPISSLFNTLFVHFGETVLFRIPASWPLIGGIITLEAAVYGLGNGMILLSLLATFVTFNRIIPTDSLIKLTPKALNDLGVVLLIALTYIPQTQRQLNQVREAQAIRGYEPKGVRGWQPILLPLLIGGLERAMGLAEAMVARGFGTTQTSGRSVWMQVGLAAGLAGALAGWIAALWVGWPGWLLVGAGGALILAIIWRLGLDVVRTQYRPRKWSTADTLLLLMALAVPLIFTLYSPALGYNIYPRLSWPPFDPFVGMVLLLLAAPALLPAQSSQLEQNDKGQTGR